VDVQDELGTRRDIHGARDVVNQVDVVAMEDASACRKPLPAARWGDPNTVFWRVFPE
jgi:hypothetical protein